MWALGCVFSELFVSVTPLFESADIQGVIIKHFEVMGLPKKEDIFYLD